MPVHAVYLRDGPRKIIMLLKPRSAEVVYTPYGIELLKLDKNRLPSYVVATGIVARNEDKYVMIPYKKGRSEEEINTLISQLDPLKKYDIKDISAGELYQGTYGSVIPVRDKLHKLVTCQSRASIQLTQLPKGSPAYKQYKDIVDLVSQKEGDAMMGKNNAYIIVSSAGFDNIYNDIRNCGRNSQKSNIYYLISSPTDMVKAGDDENGHALALTIDLSSKLIEILDPNGITPNTRHVYYWINKLLDFLKKRGYSFTRHITADEPFCPQRLSAYATGFSREGQCLIWSFWYLWLRIHNPTVPSSAIRSYLMKMSTDDAFKQTRSIASLVYK